MFTLTRNNKVHDVSGIPVFSEKSTFAQQIDVHKHPEQGYSLFIDGELQITDKDYELYHLSMLSVVPYNSSILVIGDGDGGFTNRSDWCITQVEPDSVVRKAARLLFNANWTNGLRYTLIEQTLNQYCNSNPTTKFDAIFLAITDDFNEDINNFQDSRYLWDNLLKEGGVMVSQVGCISDPNYDSYLTNHELFEIQVKPVEVINSSVYLSCFKSLHHFSILRK